MTVLNKSERYMKRKPRNFLIFVLPVILFTGCGIPRDVTVDLRETISQECVPMAKEWFLTNCPDASVKSSVLFSDGYNCTRSVSGIYEVDGVEHNYLFNCDTNEMLSDVRMDDANKIVEELTATELGISEYTDCEVSDLGFTYKVTFVNNRRDGWDEDSKTEISANYSEAGMSLHYLPFFADDAEIKKMVTKRLKSDHPIEDMWVSFYFESNVAEISENEINRFFFKYPGIERIRLICESKDICESYINPGEALDKDDDNNSDVLDLVGEYKEGK